MRGTRVPPTAKTALTAREPGPERPKKHVGGQPGHPVSTSSLANLRHGQRNPDGTVAPQRTLVNFTGGGPKLSKAEDAAQWVRLRASGVPAVEALAYFFKGDEHLTKVAIAKRAQEWDTHALTKAAWDAFNGGAWEELDDDKRVEVAVDHHIAQCAYVLYTADITHPDAAMKKIEYAKDTILAKLDADRNTEGDGGVFAEFLHKLTTNAQAALPQTFKAGVSVPAEFVDPAITKES
jgi:hypothetical protein